MIKKYKDYLIMLIIITIIGISIFLANNTYPFGYNYLLSDSIYKAHLLEVINNIDLYHNISYSFNYALGYNLFYVFIQDILTLRCLGNIFSYTVREFLILIPRHLRNIFSHTVQEFLFLTHCECEMTTADTFSHHISQFL